MRRGLRWWVPFPAGHMQESPKGCITKWNHNSVFLSLWSTVDAQYMLGLCFGPSLVLSDCFWLFHQRVNGMVTGPPGPRMEDVGQLSIVLM